MKTDVLQEEVQLELQKIAQVVEELEALASDVRGRQATLRETAAASSFLMQFYMGIENIMKRIAQYHGMNVPRSESWHVELFNRFCEPSAGKLPVLFDGELAAAVKPYRRFRHVAHHAYGVDLDWSRMEAGMRAAEVFKPFREHVLRYLEQEA